jgi:hypothetical protein
MTNLPDEGVVPHLKKLRDIVDQFGVELDALKRLEAALREANDRLDKGARIISLENKMVDALLTHEKEKPRTSPITGTKTVVALTDRVEEDLANLIAANVPNAPVTTKSNT